MPFPAHTMEIERIYTQVLEAGHRSVAVTACRSGDGVSSLTQALAQRNLLAGRSTLVVDLNLYRPSLIPLLALNHGDPSAGVFQAPQLMGVADRTIALTGISAPGGRETLVKLRTPGTLEQCISRWCEHFDTVLFDTSPLSRINANNLPAERAAAACDATLLVVLAGDSSKAMVSEAVQRLKTAGANLVGCILNDRHNPPLRTELLREIQRLGPRFDWLRRRLERRVRDSRLLALEV